MRGFHQSDDQPKCSDATAGENEIARKKEFDYSKEISLVIILLARKLQMAALAGSVKEALFYTSDTWVKGVSPSSSQPLQDLLLASALCEEENERIKLEAKTNKKEKGM